MRQTTVQVRTFPGEPTWPAWKLIDRWVCVRSHPHPTAAGATACETAVANGATDAELLVLFDAEVAAFNA